jgi:Ca2+-binding EF-hand superfamily protein
MADINLSSFQKHVQNFMNIVKSSGDAKVDEQTFTEKVTNDRSIFAMLDQNHDGKISQDEIETVCQADSDNDGIVTENELRCMQQMKFFAKRTVDKWFTLDVNRDGHWSNVENQLGEKRMFGSIPETDTSTDAAMTNEQLAKLYNMRETIDDPNNEQLEMWLDSWLDDLKQTAKDQFGVELNDRQIIVLKNEYKKQLNTWLFKTGDNATGNAPLYNSLNLTAYTRLITTEQTVSCCGGDIVPPPAADNKNSCSFVFSDLESEGSSNSAEEVKNRLAWAMFKTPPKNELSNNPNGTVWENMTDTQYTQYHQQYQTMRNMKADDFRELLKPENEQRRIAFEQSSSMTVQQIVDYIDIVEQQIGAGNFDNDNWSVSAEQYHQIVLGINGTVGDEDKLQGKTRADIPANRQNLLRFLEEKGWLYEQFKI